MIRVLLVDDHPIVRSGVSGLLETEPDFSVVGEAASGEEALEMLRMHAVDVVLMDLRMPGIGGVEATRQIVRGIAEPDSRTAHGQGAAVPRVLVFTTYEDDDEILAAVEAGAHGYLLKAAPADELAAGVRAVAAGQMVLAPSVAAQIVARAVWTAGAEPEAEAEAEAEVVAGVAHSSATGASHEAGGGVRLTRREAEIISLVREGQSNPEIARRLHIGEATVKTHLLHAFEKLGVSDRTRAVIRAMELGLIDRG